MRRLRKKHYDLSLPVWVSPTPAATLKLLLRQNALDPRLMPTDRHLQRWAVGQGTGLSNPDAADGPPKAHLDPLPQDQSIVTDQVIIHSPTNFRRFVHDWYRSSMSVEQIAERLGMTRQTVYLERRIVLAYYLGRLSEAGISIATFEIVT